MDRIRQAQAVGDNLSLVDMGTCNIETDLPCSPEPLGTTVPAGLLGVAGSSDSPALSQPLDLPWLESSHSQQPESLDSRAELKPISTSIDHPVGRVLDWLDRATHSNAVTPVGITRSTGTFKTHFKG